MNVKQAIALALGTLAALALVLVPRSSTPPRLISSKTMPNGEIVTTYRSRLSLWQPVTFAFVVLITGACVISLRRRA